MQKWMIAGIALMLCVMTSANAQDNSYAARVQRYVAQYKMLAMKEQQRTGIPAAITLGQGILETEAGSSVLVSGANNHFGIKCKSDWTGETFAHTDDAPNECFRKYKTAQDSYRDHSEYLSSAPRYSSLFKLAQTDYAGWAKGLKKCGYATNPRYAQQLIKIIEDFRLQEYTYAALNKDLIYEGERIPENDAPVTDQRMAARGRNRGRNAITKTMVTEAPVTAPANVVVSGPTTVQTVTDEWQKGDGKIFKINGLKAVYGFKGDMPLQYAVKYQMRYEHLLEINDLPDGPLAANMYIFLEKKKAKGSHPDHRMKQGESLETVAQAEGIQLRRLMAMNHLAPGEEPATGSVLELQRIASTKPEIAARTTTQPVNRAIVSNTRKPEYITKPEPQVVTPAAPAEPKLAAKEERRKRRSEHTPLTRETVTTMPVPPQPVPVVAENVKVPTEQPKAEKVEDKPMANTTPPPAAPVVTEVNNTPPPVPPAAPVVAENKPAPAPVRQAPVYNEPQDELSRLKARMDRAVYANDNKTTTSTPKQDEAKKPAAVAPKEMVAKANKDAKFYTVQKGDTAFSIAKKNKISTQELKSLNNMEVIEVKIGQRLRVK